MAAKRHFSGSNSSLQNSDDDDDDFGDNEASGLNGSSSKSREERRRISHTAAEQKRRNAIKVKIRNEKLIPLSLNIIINQSIFIFNFIFYTKKNKYKILNIKRGYEDLQQIVPSCDFMDPSSSQKVCKATVLKRCK